MMALAQNCRTRHGDLLNKMAWMLPGQRGRLKAYPPLIPFAQHAPEARWHLMSPPPSWPSNFLWKPRQDSFKLVVRWDGQARQGVYDFGFAWAVLGHH